ncbi:hypothetical protein QVD17_16220 [Tagetes erecta]|uniref:Uncharacterized protein n=1 Tax=Tagetes erecta TaxID=13708 RepID=A0AAD8NZD7_TARER|nr:hypothetical protein QVD17_16220 [Tagetes erecta]
MVVDRFKADEPWGAGDKWKWVEDDVGMFWILTLSRLISHHLTSCIGYNSKSVKLDGWVFVKDQARHSLVRPLGGGFHLPSDGCFLCFKQTQNTSIKEHLTSINNQSAPKSIRNALYSISWETLWFIRLTRNKFFFIVAPVKISNVVDKIKYKKCKLVVVSDDDGCRRCMVAIVSGDGKCLQSADHICRGRGGPNLCSLQKEDCLRWGWRRSATEEVGRRRMGSVLRANGEDGEGVERRGEEVRSV